MIRGDVYVDERERKRHDSDFISIPPSYHTLRHGDRLIINEDEILMFSRVAEK